ncbi:hypothetical protein BBJ28_00023212 [Nothophytophthora sp. Chile5]|nr:hypothetical protein BBJ28_00023212 [Nothophytophthora sp. Chile5]
MWNASHVRTGLYHGVYGGSAGFTYGANSVWQMYEPRSDLLRDSAYYAAQIGQNVSGSWRKDLDFEGAQQIQYVTKPLQGLDTLTLEQLEPARGLLGSISGSNGTVVNLYEGIQYISGWPHYNVTATMSFVMMHAGWHRLDATYLAFGGTTSYPSALSYSQN